MKIITIFAEKLYAIQYDGETLNELARLMDLWADVAYLRQFAKEYGITDVRQFVHDIREDAEFIEDLLVEMAQNKSPLEQFFKPLNNLETGIKVLSLQKGRRYKLRVYAIRIDADLFLITGGAIKIVFRMEEHTDTQKEKDKLEAVWRFLQRNGVFDDNSFYELINDDYGN
jgi:hypothetical protein